MIDSAALIETLLSHTALLSMWGALLLHWLFPLYDSHYHPLALWRQIADSINEKANHSQDPVQQQRLSGTLAFLLMWFGASLVLIFASLLFGGAWIFDCILLWLALGWRALFDQTKQLKQLLSMAQKPAARQLLAKIVKRDTSCLSDTELNQLACETLLVGLSRTLINVLFFYAIAGGVGAFLYTLLMHLSREWSPRLTQFRHFGLNPARVLTLVEWLPARLFALFVVVGNTLPEVLKAIRTQSYQSNAEFIWVAIGSKYQIALGGCALYDDHKIERVNFGGEVLPSATHFAKLSQRLINKALLWIGLQSIIMMAIFL